MEDLYEFDEDSLNEEEEIEEKKESGGKKDACYQKTGLVAKAPPARKVAGLIATLAARIKRQERKSAHLVAEAAAKRDQNTPHADLPPALVVKEENGARNLKKEKKDETN